MTQKQLLSLSHGDDQAAIHACLSTLRAGGLVVIPTETVYGVAILPSHDQGLRALKANDARPFSLAIDRLERLSAHLAPLSRPALRLAERWWPGPLTQVLPDVRGGTLGVRIPDHGWTRQLLEAAGEPLLLSSANLPGEPPPTAIDQLSPAVRDAVDVIIDGGVIAGGVASTVVATGLASLRVLREGGISRGALADHGLGQVLVACTGNTCRSPMARALLEVALAALAKEDSSLILPEVVSAGVHGGLGQPASSGALAAMASRGLDLSAHGSCPLEQITLQDADLLLGMTSSHAMALLALASPEQNVALFDPSGEEVPDPFGGPPSVYEACAQHLEQAALLRARSLLPFESSPS